MQLLRAVQVNIDVCTLSTNYPGVLVCVEVEPWMRAAGVLYLQSRCGQRRLSRGVIIDNVDLDRGYGVTGVPRNFHSSLQLHNVST